MGARSRLLDMRHLPIILSLFLIFSNAAGATSRRAGASSSSTAPYCEITGRYNHPNHQVETIIYNGAPQREARVSWSFDIESVAGVGGGQCPSGVGFELAIRGADFVDLPDGSQQYVYPVYVEVLEANTRVLIRAREVDVQDPRTGRQFKEWIVINWTQGIEKK